MFFRSVHGFRKNFLLLQSVWLIKKVINSFSAESYILNMLVQSVKGEILGKMKPQLYMEVAILVSVLYWLQNARAKFWERRSWENDALYVLPVSCRMIFPFLLTAPDDFPRIHVTSTTLTSISVQWDKLSIYHRCGDVSGYKWGWITVFFSRTVIRWQWLIPAKFLIILLGTCILIYTLYLFSFNQVYFVINILWDAIQTTCRLIVMFRTFCWLKISLLTILKRI